VEIKLVENRKFLFPILISQKNCTAT
jgi:hypothetical protein